MKQVQGIGGIFFKAQDPDRLLAWYSEHLGISPLAHSPWGDGDTAPLFEWRDKDDPTRTCYTVWGVFPADTKDFGPGDQSFMFNFRVDDLDAVLEQLRQAGVEINEAIREYPYGRFVRVTDPEGNPIELWEPAEGF